MSTRSSALRWLALVAMTVMLTGVGMAIGLSAALLVGSMGAAIVLASRDAAVRVPPALFFAAQVIIGCMIAGAIKTSILREMLTRWPLFAGAIFAVLATAITLGALLTRWGGLPGTTALWGSFPGAATAMALMAESFGADIRLVAFMQYLRVVVVALVASGVARLWIDHAAATVGHAWFVPVHWFALAATAVIGTVGARVATLLRVPAAPMIGPMVLGAVLQNLAGLEIELPSPLLAAAYTIVGWGIGLRFSRDLLRHAARAFPSVAAAILILVACCGFFAAVLVVVAGIDPLTAYLATSPGGADSVAIIASSTKVDLPFVMAMQMTRFLFILVFGPSLARFVASRLEAPRGTGAP